jgi:hypothetical protein
MNDYVQVGKLSKNYLKKISNNYVRLQTILVITSSEKLLSKNLVSNWLNTFLTYSSSKKLVRSRVIMTKTIIVIPLQHSSLFLLCPI